MKIIGDAIREGGGGDWLRRTETALRKGVYLREELTAVYAFI